MVHVVDPLKEPVILAADTLACPDNSYAFDLAPGSYYRRVMLQGAFLGELPRVSMDANPVRLGGQAVTNDFRVEEGTEVLGERSSTAHRSSGKASASSMRRRSWGSALSEARAAPMGGGWRATAASHPACSARRPMK